MNDGLCLTPNVNLVTNIGVHGTHFSGDSKLLNLSVFDYDFQNIVNYHPLPINNLDYTLKYYNYIIPKTHILTRVLIIALKKIRLFNIVRLIKRSLFNKKI